MRSVDMRVGEAYALTGDRPVKVTVLETPPELRRQARVCVRFESGVMAGETGDLLSRRIASPWDGHLEPRTPRTPRRTHLVVVERDPGVGDSVTWTETAGLVWSLVALDPKTGLAKIDGAIFGQPANHDVPLSQLRVHVEASEPRGHIEIAPIAEPSVASDAPRPQATNHLRPETPKRLLEEVLDDVLFSQLCLESYKKRYARKRGLAAAGHQLREEIRRRGFIMDGGLPGSDEYARLRVLRRFDVVLMSRPTPDQPITVDRLHFPRSARDSRKRRNASPKRQAA